jgi:acetylornithine deacetylase/succinyl-diaminopimelate desuccinylase-like protein
VTRAYLERMAAAETPEVAAAIKALLAGRSEPDLLEPLSSRPDYNAQIRTTCVATMLDAGHAENALPQTARATVNCRVMPDESVEEVERTLARVIGDEKVAIIRKGTAVLSPPSAVNPEVMQTVGQLSVQMWPGVPLNTTMSAGYTDNRWLRNAGIAAYGVSGLFSDPGKNGVHGRNERVGIKELYDSKLFLYRLVKRLAAPSQVGQR